MWRRSGLKLTLPMSKSMLYKVHLKKRSISDVSCVFLRDSNRQKKQIDNLPTPTRSVQRQKRSSLPSWCTTSMEMAAYPKRCSRKQSMYWQYIVLLVMKVLLRSCWLCWAWWWGPMSLLANSCQLLIGCYLKPTWIRWLSIAFGIFTKGMHFMTVKSIFQDFVQPGWIHFFRGVSRVPWQTGCGEENVTSLFKVVLDYNLLLIQMLSIEVVWYHKITIRRYVM